MGESPTRATTGVPSSRCGAASSLRQPFDDAPNVASAASTPNVAVALVALVALALVASITCAILTSPATATAPAQTGRRLGGCSAFDNKPKLTVLGCALCLRRQRHP